MPMTRSTIRITRATLPGLRLATRLFLAATTAGLLASFAAPWLITRSLLSALPAADLPAALTGARWLLLIGIAMGAAVHRLLPALASLLDAIDAGDPFADTSAAHLRTIAWCLAALQLTALPAIALRTTVPELGTAAPDGSISITGCLVVVLLFALARAWDAGARLRADLEFLV